MNFICLIGMRHTIPDQIQKTVCQLKESQQRIWYFSSDQYSKTISIGYQTSILPQDAEIFHLNQIDKEQIKYFLRSKLDLIKTAIIGEDCEKKSAFASKKELQQ